MTDYADLEIGLHRRDVTSYAVDLRFIHPDSDADVRLVRGVDLPRARFDPDPLRSLASDPAAYGQALTAQLCADPAVPAAFAQAFAAAQSLDLPLRVRLFIGPSAPDLHALRWETLCVPGTTERLLMNEHLLFSRYLSSTDWRPVKLRPKRDLRALVVVSNPSNVSEYAPGGTPLASLDVAGEVARAGAALGDLPTTVLASTGQATLAALLTHLRDGYDILYLVAHGAMLQGDPHLWLEDAQGQAAVVLGSDLVRQVRDLRERPRLVVLASCQSAGSGEEGVLAALGPRLAEAGIPAVLAMQGNVTLETVETFLPVFFRELLRDGQIDRAMAAARGMVRERPDWWVPVLFLRLREGRLWEPSPTVPAAGPSTTEMDEAPHPLARTYAAFLSFTPFDDEFSRGALRQFRAELERTLQFLSGGRIAIFQEQDSISLGQNIPQRITQSLHESLILIPLVTPNYCKHDGCRQEFLRFLERERHLGRNDLILWVYYQRVPTLEQAIQRLGHPDTVSDPIIRG